MQENNFEDKVNKAMEGFSMNPSEKVWGKIQADIDGKRKRRFIIIPFLLFTAILLAPVSIFYLNNSGKKNKSIETASTSIENKKAEPSPQLGRLNATTKKDQAITDNKTKKESTQTTAEQTSSATATVLPMENKNAQSISGVSKTRFAVSKPKRVKQAGRQTTTIAAGAVDEPEDEKEKIGSVSTIGKDNADKETAVTTETSKAIAKKDSITEEKKKEQPLIAKTENKKKKAKGKWDFYIAAAAGMHSTSTNYLGEKISSELLYYDNLSTTPGSGTGNGSVTYQPSTIKSGVAASIQFKAARQISTKTLLLFGLGYQYATTSVSTGQLVYSNTSSAGLNNSYATGNSNVYYNRYHFIQLPVEIQSLFGKGRKLPLGWNAGLTYSRLIHSDALQFDRSVGRYYADNNYLNKNIFGLSAGLSLSILKNNAINWQIGPQIQYSLTPASGSGFYNKTHYGFLGLRIQKKL